MKLIIGANDLGDDFIARVDPALRLGKRFCWQEFGELHLFAESSLRKCVEVANIASVSDWISQLVFKITDGNSVRARNESR